MTILGGDEGSTRATLSTAIGLATETNARLTLVKTCEPPRCYVWAAPFAAGGAYVPAESESPQEAARALCRLADEVPNAIPVTMLVLPPDAQAGVLRLLRERRFGLVVASQTQLAHWRRVRQELRRAEIQIVLVGATPAVREETPPAPSARTGPGRARRPGLTGRHGLRLRPRPPAEA
jgi:hypothetical protein